MKRRSLSLLATVILLLAMVGSFAQATTVAAAHVEATAKTALLLVEHGHVHSDFAHDARDHVHDQEVLIALPCLVADVPKSSWDLYVEQSAVAPRLPLLDRPPRFAA